MRILHLTWEYPPVMYGGLGRHVHALANAQAANGHDVVVITQAPNSAAPARVPWGSTGPVRVLRATIDPSTHDPRDLLAHVAEMECEFTGHGIALFADWQPDVIHAHDWMVAHAAVALRDRSGAPLTATIHATEAGRNRGWVTTDLSTAIHAIEWWLANTADAVIACSRTMRREVETLFGLESAHVVANGIALADWKRPEFETARISAENADAHPLLAYTGRVEWEKGLQTLVSAMPALRRAHPGIRLLVAGRGSYLDDVQRQAANLGLDGSVRFLGWVSEEDLRAIVAAADVAIAPSLYEPFGLVALEAAAMGTPLVVSNAGGLAEFAEDGARALTFTPGDAASLEGAVNATLADPRATAARTERARESVLADYDWRVLARKTTDVYAESAVNLGSAPDDTRHQMAAARRVLVPPRFDAPPGRLLDDPQ
ncbi:MAG TPA: glycosyltransferase family 4 protein [Motilibacterales bacterium]|nr:glycosyltransferase family 4 protein [Motilibacterales bacterium]